MDFQISKFNSESKQELVHYLQSKEIILKRHLH